MTRRRPILRPVTRARKVAVSVSTGAFGLLGVVIASKGVPGAGAADDPVATTPALVGPAGTTSTPSTTTAPPTNAVTRRPTQPTTTTTWAAQPPSTASPSPAPATTRQGRTRVS